ncbi:hypothetical protein P4637_17365 [Halalkalibacterium halodurans]|uniref:Uncharacterized protein n=1 Tax=Halalkalibacterium halodurans TaxID=86665 RepID=A0A0M0KHF2_ALKHA|nr:hypothetical protein [Halalkalibacterium halodurans]MED3646003.1 hypothetical protein [Halalkalibacterium halodurans]MED4080860.1 hypothetical protein [Halalkalibacterium halodurans]MED4086585.1 hypothetical protein [Halalkalibacterium halodurans]MED4106958.1 hypothetical protein [Halalkalibacterium halodurans]MED4110327.1 hypothetical protein [Halalkalibacterium halodurans]
MTIIMPTWLFMMVSILFTIGVSFLLSVIMSKFLKKGDKRKENMAGFLAAVVTILLVIATSEAFVERVYEGDVLFTADKAWEVEDATARYLSTERPLVVANLFRHGYYESIETNELGTMRIHWQVTHYPEIYERAMELHSEGTHFFPFQAYYEAVVQPVVTDVLEEEPPSLSAMEEMINDRLPGHEANLNQ